MKYWGIIALAALAVGAVGCDDDDPTPEQMEAEVSDAEVDAGVDMAPPFNYIPLNDKACILADQTVGVQQAVDDALLDLIRGGTTGVGDGLEICTEAPMNACPACSNDENRLNALIEAFSGPFTEYLTGFGGGQVRLDSLGAYFAEALRYPLRHLTVTVTPCDGLAPGSCPAGASHRLVLSQSKKQTCAEGFAACDHYSVEPESFDETCAGPPLTLYGAVEALAEGGQRLTAELPEEARDSVTFGFIVPLILDLPPDPETLTDDALRAWLDELDSLENRLDVRVLEPRVVIDYTDDPTDGCGRMTGYVDAQTFVDLVEAEEPAFAELFTETLLPQYVDATDPTRIYGMMSFEMAAGTFTSGVPCSPDPCGDDTTTCAGDVLEHRIEQTRCTLERGADFTNGDPIGPTCAVTGTTTWPVDCAALGGACAEDMCTVEWRVPAVGELVISELYFGNSDRPEGVRQTQHQWVELTNVTDEALRIDGCYVRTRAAGLLGNTRTIRTAGPAVVPPRGTFVFAKVLDPALNGGVEADYGLGSTARLNGAGNDSFTLFCGYAEIDHVAWTTDGNARGTRDASVQLDAGQLDAASNDEVDGAGWCPATAGFGADGKLGTPGAANTACP